MPQPVNIRIDVPELAQVEAAINLMRTANRAATMPQPVTPSGQAAQQRGWHAALVTAAEGVGYAIGSGLRAPFDVLGTTMRMVGGPITSIFAAFSQLLTSVLTLNPALIALTVGTIAVTAAVGSLAAVYQLLKTSFDWASESAEQQLKVLAQTRRTFPGIVGQELEAREPYVRAKMAATAALFGQGAEALQERITRQFTDARMGRGLGGDRDIFSRLGINAQAIQQYEAVTGQRMGLTDWLAAFIGERERIEARQAAAGSDRERRELGQRKARLIDDSLKLFNQKFADLAATMSTQDLAIIQRMTTRSGALARVEDADQKAIEFDRQLKTTRVIFGNLRDGIANDAMPAMTQFFFKLNRALLDTADGGLGMGRQLRELAAALGVKAWEALDLVLKEIKPETVKEFIEYVRQWNPADVIKSIQSGVTALTDLFNIIVEVIDRIEAAWGRSRRLRAERERRRQAGEDSWLDWMPPFVPGAPGYGALQRELRGQYARPAVGGRGGAPLFRGTRGGAAAPDGNTSGIPGNVVSQAAAAAVDGGMPAVDRLLRQYGYNRSQAWCGMFAAAVVRSVGGTPPAHPEVASNWRNFGTEVTDPQPGDVAVRIRSRFGGGATPTGARGSHVTFVESVDRANGLITVVGGNQGGGRATRTTYRLSDFTYHRGDIPQVGDAVNTAGRTPLATGDLTRNIYDPATTAVPASVRNANIGAKWPSWGDIKYGGSAGVLYDPSNKIAQFSTVEGGIAANMELLLTSRNYQGMTVSQAISTWSGRHRASVPGFAGNEIIGPDFLDDPNRRRQWFRALAAAEAGRNWVTDEQIERAWNIYQSGGLQKYHQRRQVENEAALRKHDEMASLLRDPERDRELLTRKAGIGEAVQKGTAAGDAAGKAFLNRIKDYSMPVSLPKLDEKDRDKDRSVREEEPA